MLVLTRVLQIAPTAAKRKKAEEDDSEVDTSPPKKKVSQSMIWLQADGEKANGDAGKWAQDTSDGSEQGSSQSCLDTGIFNEEICERIVWDNRIRSLRKLGRARGWPISFDFSYLVVQVLRRADDITELITDSIALENAYAWDDFLQSIDYRIFAFGAQYSRSKKGFEYADVHARCGYLGPQGTRLLGSTLCRIIAHNYSELKAKLRQSLAQITIKNYRKFDQDTRTDTSEPILSMDLFIEYILVPAVAIWLIAEDMDTSFADAREIKDASHDFGDMFHWDLEDDAIVALDAANDAASETAPPTPQVPVIDPPRNVAHFRWAPSENELEPTNTKPPKVKRKPSIQTTEVHESVELTLQDFPARSKSKAKPKKQPPTRKPKEAKRAAKPKIERVPVSRCLILAISTNKGAESSSWHSGPVAGGLNTEGSPTAFASTLDPDNPIFTRCWALPLHMSVHEVTLRSWASGGPDLTTGYGNMRSNFGAEARSDVGMAGGQRLRAHDLARHGRAMGFAGRDAVKDLPDGNLNTVDAFPAMPLFPALGHALLEPRLCYKAVGFYPTTGAEQQHHGALITRKLQALAAVHPFTQQARRRPHALPPPRLMPPILQLDVAFPAAPAVHAALAALETATTRDASTGGVLTLHPAPPSYETLGLPGACLPLGGHVVTHNPPCRILVPNYHAEPDATSSANHLGLHQLRDAAHEDGSSLSASATALAARTHGRRCPLHHEIACGGKCKSARAMLKRKENVLGLALLALAAYQRAFVL
ncbi:hypothetical protein B0H15DRAFT_807387 [Mycena belliarum]|uniref:Restriction of telomere capping protein 4 C-terminal domain-containing protein n=1 Tax=Mycena belliarum TaxID=1033014 RepID=A0AAD6TPR3_9AGAR|nr:hypothetical protein B0H15DRAFT_807387 [Mycena belliae]